MNSIPRSLNVLRPTLADIAAWVNVSRSLVDLWRSAARQPRDEDRAALVKAVRQHAQRLLTLAAKMEREGLRK